MLDLSLEISAPARIRGLVLFLCAGSIASMLLLAAPAAVAAPLEDHQQALAALADVKAAINELVGVDASYSTDRSVYHRASQRAINLLAGEHGDGYVAGQDLPKPGAGAIGHIDSLLDRTASPVWVGPLRGSETNLLAAVSYLRDSLTARELMDYQLATSRAIAYLEVARGRPTETGVLGGLEGALANTVLGVPAGAKQEDGCGMPSSAPAYGTHEGYLAWAAVPGGDGSHTLPEAPGGTEVVVSNGVIVLRTAAASLVEAACNRHAEAGPPAANATTVAPQGVASVAPGGDATPAAPTGGAGTHVPAQSPASASAGEAAAAPAGAAGSGTGPSASSAASAAATPAAAPASVDPVPALYTKAQAKSGARLFATTCAKCHGANLQGSAAPSVAGNDFLQTAKRNGWTLAIIRYLVVNNMPMNSPSSLTTTQYASLLAFLLASDCYPAGDKPFPVTADPSFASLKMGPVPGKHPGQNSKGVCKVN
jgi:polar amino acid transport system substrate-binding protein